MDNRLARALLNKLILDQIVEDIIIERTITTCDVCKKQCQIIHLTKCVVCDEVFCPNCIGKENVPICRTCNNNLISWITRPTLNELSVKNLIHLSKMYDINHEGINEKSQLIDKILVSLKKCNELTCQSVVDVQALQTNMQNLKVEELKAQQQRVVEKNNQMKRMGNYSNCKYDPFETILIGVNSEKIVDKTLEDIDTMSVGNLKIFLTDHDVKIEGIFEKSELKRLAKRVVEQYTASNMYIGGSASANSDSSQVKLCCICLDSEVSCVFLECRHCCVCHTCGENVNECPLCRQNILKKIKIFL